MTYYKIQFAPFRYFIKNYLCYNKEKGFYLWHSGSATYFLQEQIYNNDDLKKFLQNKRYRLIHVKDECNLYKYKVFNY